MQYTAQQYDDSVPACDGQTDGRTSTLLAATSTTTTTTTTTNVMDYSAAITQLRGHLTKI